MLDGMHYTLMGVSMLLCFCLWADHYAMSKLRRTNKHMRDDMRHLGYDWDERKQHFRRRRKK